MVGGGGLRFRRLFYFICKRRKKADEELERLSMWNGVEGSNFYKAGKERRWALPTRITFHGYLVYN